MLWIVFSVAMVAMLAIDLGVFQRTAHTVRFKEALAWSIAWSALALLFMCLVYYVRGPDDGIKFLSGYLVEWSLSVDNLFVFLLIFGYFHVASEHQHRVLFWGIIGAVITRGLLIGAGVLLIQRVHWIVYVFGTFLVITGLRMLFSDGESVHPERNPVLRLVRRFIPLTPEVRGARFFVREGGRRLATPLFIVLMVIETTDIVFAVDSVPAVLSITSDPFIVFTSNMFAILGLRSMYFALAGVMGLFHYIRFGLAGILAFVGTKMLVASYIEIPPVLTLGVIAAVLALAVVASLMWPPKKAPAAAAPAQTRGPGA
jgi:tellurite resistance protein TerC